MISLLFGKNTIIKSEIGKWRKYCSMEKKEIKELISRMTLEEKASLCSGQDFWHTKKVARLNVPDFMVSDGPHGLRKQNLEA